jgi:hypothetical protein
MSSESQQVVVELARQIHQKNWTEGSHVSTQTKAAQRISKEWQSAVLGQFGERFRHEYLVSALALGYERIDLVDSLEAVAFEFKVSAKNTHFEFYRDIFKVAVHNKEAREFKIRRLVFITPMIGAEKLQSSFVKSVSCIAREDLGFDVEVVGI